MNTHQSDHKNACGCSHSQKEEKSAAHQTHNHSHDDKNGHVNGKHTEKSSGHCCSHSHSDTSGKTLHNRAGTETVDHSSCKCAHGEAIATVAVKSSENIRRQPVPQGYERSQWRIEAMDCPVEEAMIRKQLASMDNVQAMEFNLMQRTLTAIYHENTQGAIEAAITALGMEAKAATGDEEPEAVTPPVQQKRTLLLAVGGLVLAVCAEAAHYFGLPALASAIPSIIAILMCGLGTYRKGLIAIRHGELNINALMSIAVTGAAVIGQWPEAAMVMALFTISELIEARSLDRARMAIRSLLQLSPEAVTVQQRDGSWMELPPKKVQIGDIVRVRPGQRIALDGTIIRGNTSIDQSAVTGESLPIDKKTGDCVFAGTLNASGEFEFRITATSQNSTLARIIHAVEEAQSERAPTQRFVDKFARYYTPAIVLIAFIVAILPPLALAQPWTTWAYRALVLLVIACPCALVISTPVTIVSALTAASKRGLLVKGGVYMENGRFLRWLALDKTGTVTHGQPVQTDLFVFPTQASPNDSNADVAQIRQIAASLAARSDHPVSMALAKAAQTDGIALLPVEAFNAIAGQGTRATIRGKAYFLGNRKMAHEAGTLTTQVATQFDLLEKKGQTVVALGTTESILALFAVSDTIKPTSQQAIQTLHQMGVNTLMLSGDNPHTAQIIASQAGISEARGNQLPQDKRQAIEEKQKQMADAHDTQGMIGMVGDGINDAPALARADIGFAMGAAGTDTAMETADVAIMDDDLRKIPEFIQLSKRTHTVLMQNITLALGIKAVFLALTIMGQGTMWMAVFADVGASLLVVFNGLRMLRR